MSFTVYKGDPLPKTSIPYGWLTCRSGIASLSLDPGKTLLYAAAMDDVIYEFNVASYDENPGMKLNPVKLSNYSYLFFGGLFL